MLGERAVRDGSWLWLLHASFDNSTHHGICNFLGLIIWRGRMTHMQSATYNACHYNRNSYQNLTSSLWLYFVYNLCSHVTEHSIVIAVFNYIGKLPSSNPGHFYNHSDRNVVIFLSVSWWRPKQYHQIHQVTSSNLDEDTRYPVFRDFSSVPLEKFRHGTSNYVTTSSFPI